MNLTLTNDSSTRKSIPLFGGVRKYFPAALAGVARHSKRGNDKHNPGEPLHHARGKSMDHEECIDRHLTDVADLQALIERIGEPATKDEAAVLQAVKIAILEEADALSWRSLALSQKLYEIYGGAPLAPGAVEPSTETVADEKFRVGAIVRTKCITKGIIVTINNPKDVLLKVLHSEDEGWDVQSGDKIPGLVPGDRGCWIEESDIVEYLS